MILLTDVATKLEELLNLYSPSDYSFVVKSAGYHLDSISNKKKARNQIPVFVSLVGGEYNPVPNLKETDYTFEVNIYYPVRFKEDFYNINPYLSNLFVGKKLSFGSDNALCNISVAEYGEIIDFDAIREFENWVEEQFNGAMHLFKKEEQVNEFYMSMRFRLFATTLGEGFIFGNDVKYRLTAKMPIYQKQVTKINVKLGEGSTTVRVFNRKATDDVGGKFAWSNTTSDVETVFYTDSYLPGDLSKDDVKLYTYLNDEFDEVNPETYVYDGINKTEDILINTKTLTEQLVWDNSGTGASISPVSEQLIGVDKFAKNMANITNFNKSLVAYIRDNEFWQTFLYLYNKQSLDEIEEITLQKVYNFNGTEYTYDYEQIILTYNENVELGSPLSFTLTFGD